MALVNYPVYKIRIDHTAKKQQGLKVGDIVRRQYEDEQNLIYSLMVVLEIGTDTLIDQNNNEQKSPYFIGGLLEGNEPQNGEMLDFVRVTSLLNSERSGALYLTSSDQESPYMDVIDGIAEEKSICFPTALGGEPNVPSLSKYACTGTEFIRQEYFATKDSKNRVFRVTCTSDDAEGESIGIKQTFEKLLSPKEQIIVSFWARAKVNSPEKEISIGYTDGSEIDGSTHVKFDYYWQYYFYCINIDYPTQYSRSFYLDLTNGLRRGDFVEIADLNILPLSAFSSFSDATKSRIGKIKGIADPLFGVLNGYGAYFQNLYATKNVNIAGTLTAGDEKGFASTFYVGKIHKNCIQNSLQGEFETPVTIVETEKSPTGIGHVIQLPANLTNLKAQSESWANRHSNEIFCLSFWAKANEPGELKITQNNQLIDSIEIETPFEWKRYHVSFPIFSQSGKDYTLGISSAISGVYFSSPQLEVGKTPTLYQATDKIVTESEDYGAWFNQGGLGGTIQNPLLKFTLDGSIVSNNGSFVIKNDGSGFFSNGAIKWDEKEVVLGENVKLKWENLDEEAKENLKGQSGNDAYSVHSTQTSIIIHSDENGIPLKSQSVTSTVTAYKGNNIAAFSFGDIPVVSGLSISKNNTLKTITFSVVANVPNLADTGNITIPINVDGITFSVPFSWSKAKNGASGTEGSQLDWVEEWNSGKTIIDANTIITPKIFAGDKNVDNSLSGVAIGNFNLTTKNPSGNLVSTLINGIYGLKDGYKTFSLDHTGGSIAGWTIDSDSIYLGVKKNTPGNFTSTSGSVTIGNYGIRGYKWFFDATGNAQLGSDEQFIKYNSISGKIEFGSGVSLNWTNAIEKAKEDTIDIAISSAKEQIENQVSGGINLANIALLRVYNTPDITFTETGFTCKDSTYNGVYFFPRTIFQPLTDYYLSFQIRRTGGTLDRIGGHSIAHPTKKILIDNVEYKYSWHDPIELPFLNDGEWHTVELFFRTKEDVIDYFYIQPNRVRYALVSYELINLNLREGNIRINYSAPPESINEKINNAQSTADAITKKAQDQGWDQKLTYIDSKGIFTGILSANIVEALNINASQITTGTIDAGRINVIDLQAKLITAENIEALKLNVVQGKIGGWNIDSDSIYSGSKSNATGGYTSSSGSITIGSFGIRGNKWKLDSTGAGAIAGGNISWDIAGNVTFGADVSLQWTNAATEALNSAKEYADNINVGGRNYLLASGNEKSSTNSVSNGGGHLVYRTNLTPDLLQVGEDFTLSFEAKGAFNGEISSYGNNSDTYFDKHIISITTEWQRYVIPKQILRVNSRNLQCEFWGIEYGMWIYLRNVKLERGTRATDWTIAPEEVDEKLTYMDANGIYTGTLSAKQVNAVEINAESIKTGILDADRIAAGSINGNKITANSITATEINVANLQASLITADVVNGLSCDFVQGTIGKWKINANNIYKNNVYLTSDGTIINGDKWRLNNDGSGALASGNISWDSSGKVTFTSSVSLNWTDSIDSAKNELKTEINNVKVEGILYCKGTGAHRMANRIISLNGKDLYNGGGRGLLLTILKRQDLTVQSSVIYDIYGSDDKRTELANALNALDDSVIIILTSYDAIIIDNNLSKAMARCGGSGVLLSYRNPYALVGIPGIGKGAGIEVYSNTEANDPFAEITTKVVNGIPQGVNSIQKTALEIADNTQAALGGSSYPKLTKIDSTGIYTGTLTASQITAGTISVDRIAAGSITSAKLDAASIKSNIINTTYINGLELAFTKGTIGGWSIGSDHISHGSLGAGGATPIQIRTTSTGSGYWYTGAYKPKGITLTWHQSGNAGHVVFGQVAASGNTVKSGFYGIQMMTWDNQEHFCLSANTSKSGSKEIYNRIAGWAFDNGKIWKNNVTLGSDGAITNGSAWKLNNDGSGQIANGKISWTTAGAITFASDVSVNWTSGINTAQEIARAMAFGKMLYRYPEFYHNGAVHYNGSGGYCIENTTRSIVAYTGTPNSTGYALRFVSTAWRNSTDLRIGGFSFANPSRANAIFIARIIALIPSGRSIQNHHNAYGTGGTTKWLTSQAGTGKWEEYICKVTCGASGTFSTINHFALNGGTAPTSAAPVTWYIAYATIFDITAAEKYTTTIDANGIYTGTVKANQIHVDSALVVGGSTYNGSISVRNASNVVQATLDRNGITAIAGKIAGWNIKDNSLWIQNAYGGGVGLHNDGYMYNCRWSDGKDYWALHPDGSAEFGFGKVTFKKDGSGTLAGGNISWTTSGDLTVKGKITAGSIGGFTIDSGRIGSTASGTGAGGGLAIYDNLFRVGSNTSYVLFGDNTIPASAGGSLVTTGRITNHRSTSLYTNYGLYMDVKNAKQNFGIYSNAPLQAPYYINSKIKNISFGSGSYTMDLAQHNLFFIYGTANTSVNLPDEAAVRNYFGLSALPSDFATVFTLVYNYNYGYKVTINNIRNNNGNLENRGMEKGDVLTLMCAKFPAFHYQMISFHG